MDIFTRRFAIEKLAAWHRQYPAGGLGILFDRWVLPGSEAGTHGLRVGIRDGYLNLYVKGQSVAALRMIGDAPTLKLHQKYFVGARNGTAGEGAFSQSYTSVAGADLQTLDADTVDKWIETAETYAGDEKRFVDDLVAVSPGTLDLEMGLPADDAAVGKERTSPRMDLVIAQGAAIEFWEAKCAVNGELRARAPYKEVDGGYVEGPHVLWQLRRYQRWMGREHRVAQVRNAYVATAHYLIELAELFGKTGPAIAAWRKLADAGNAAKVILPPGVVLANYCPTRADGKPRDEAVTYRGRAASFKLHGHRARLERHGATVVEVDGKPSSTALPDLTPGTISDTEQLA